MSKLETPVPPFIRRVSVNVVHHFEIEGNDNVLGTKKLNFKLAIHSMHGPECALPMIRSVSFFFQGSQDPQSIVCAQAPFEVEKQITSVEECIIKIQMELEEAGELDDVSMVYTGAREAALKLKNEDDGAAVAELNKGEQVWTFVSQIVHYHTKDEDEGGEGDRSGKKARLE